MNQIAFAAVALVAGLIGAQPQRQPGRPERPRVPDGPWRHQIHFLTSDDGLTFQETAEPVMKQASVPDIIELARELPSGDGVKKGSLCIYTVDAREGRHGLSRLASDDGGKTWGRPRMLSFDWGEREGRGEVDPSVVQLADGRLRLYFYSMTGAPGPSRPSQPLDPNKPGGTPPVWEPPGKKPETPKRPEWEEPEKPAEQAPERGKHRVYSAVSEDGLKFKVEEGVRFEADEITDPEVVRMADEWLMFLSRGQEVLLARSEDGLEWRQDRSFILRGGGVPGALVLSDGRVRVYQSGPDGITSVVFDPASGMFRPDEGVRVKGPCADPAVWPRSGGGYVAVVKRFMGNEPRTK